MKKVEFGLQKNLANNLVLIDGVSRTGKSVFSNVISTFKNIEQISFNTLLEHFIPAISLGKIEKNFAKSTLRTLFNELAYEKLLSRNVNFRPKDQTSVLNFHDPNLYKNRLKRVDDYNVIKELKKKKRFFPFMTHDIMVNLDHFEKLDFSYKIIELYRNPIDVSYSWYNRGLGERFNNDERIFTLSIQYNNFILPWYCAGKEKEWLKLNPMERCVYLTLDLTERAVRQQKKTKFPNKIYTLKFENFVENSNEEIKKISKFLGKKTTSKTKIFLKKANCPRKLDSSKHIEKIKILKAGISKKLFKKLMNTNEFYTTSLYDLKY